MRAPLAFLLSPIYSGALAPDHGADLAKSGLTEETIRCCRLMSVPPSMVGRLLGFDAAAVHSAMLLPFPHPLGGFMDHVRVKVFPELRGEDGHTVKYLGPRGEGPHLFFALPTLAKAMAGSGALWLVEGAKKALAVAQTGRAAIGFEGVEAWHLAGSRALLPDFEHVQLASRIVELVPDGDWRTNPNVARGARRFAEALLARCARVRLVMLPLEVSAA